MNDLVTISGLSKAYGHFMALNNLNLNIPRGRIIGLLGPNGSGKTTLIKLLNGLLTPSSGQILIDGKAPGVETKKKVSYLPERTYLTSSRTVIDVVEYVEDFYDKSHVHAGEPADQPELTPENPFQGHQGKGSAGAGYEQGSRSLHPG